MMEQYLSEILLAVLISIGFPLIWKTNSLLTRLMNSSEQSSELLSEAIKNLRHNEIEHLKIVNALDALKTELLHELKKQ